MELCVTACEKFSNNNEVSETVDQLKCTRVMTQAYWGRVQGYRGQDRGINCRSGQGIAGSCRGCTRDQVGTFAYMLHTVDGWAAPNKTSRAGCTVLCRPQVTLPNHKWWVCHSHITIEPYYNELVRTGIMRGLYIIKFYQYESIRYCMSGIRNSFVMMEICYNGIHYNRVRLY